jgi:hypothetical protein
METPYESSSPSCFAEKAEYDDENEDEESLIGRGAAQQHEKLP